VRARRAEHTGAAAGSWGRRDGRRGSWGGGGLYTRTLQAKGVKIVRLTGADRLAILSCINAVKAGDTGEAPRAEMRRLAAALIGAGAEVVIAGCTEVPLLLAADEVSVPLVDSAEVLAAACVRACA